MGAPAKKNKQFDAVKMKREVQARLAEEMREMTPEERIAYIRQQVQNGPFAKFFYPDQEDSAPQK